MNAIIEKGRLRVVKLGGSLLDWPEFPAQLRTWLGQQTPSSNALIAGGGAFADVIRDADRSLHLGEVTSHKLCIDILGITARMLAVLLPELRGPLPVAAIEPSLESQTAIVDVSDLMALDERESIRPLPASWEVTTDSIAARAAILMNADELVLLKSALPERVSPPRALAEAGYVDPHFPICAKSVRKIRFVNLRSPDFAERVHTNPHPPR